MTVFWHLVCLSCLVFMSFSHFACCSKSTKQDLFSHFFQAEHKLWFSTVRSGICGCFPEFKLSLFEFQLEMHKCWKSWIDKIFYCGAQQREQFHIVRRTTIIKCRFSPTLTRTHNHKYICMTAPGQQSGVFSMNRFGVEWKRSKTDHQWNFTETSLNFEAMSTLSIGQECISIHYHKHLKNREQQHYITLNNIHIKNGLQNMFLKYLTTKHFGYRFHIAEFQLSDMCLTESPFSSFSFPNSDRHFLRGCDYHHGTEFVLFHQTGQGLPKHLYFCMRRPQWSVYTGHQVNIQYSLCKHCFVHTSIFTFHCSVINRNTVTTVSDQFCKMMYEKKVQHISHTIHTKFQTINITTIGVKVKHFQTIVLHVRTPHVSLLDLLHHDHGQNLPVGQYFVKFYHCLLRILEQTKLQQKAISYYGIKPQSQFFLVSGQRRYTYRYSSTSCLSALCLSVLQVQSSMFLEFSDITISSQGWRTSSCYYHGVVFYETDRYQALETLAVCRNVSVSYTYPVFYFSSKQKVRVAIYHYRQHSLNFSALIKVNECKGVFINPCVKRETAAVRIQNEPLPWKPIYMPGMYAIHGLRFRSATSQRCSKPAKYEWHCYNYQIGKQFLQQSGALEQSFVHVYGCDAAFSFAQNKRCPVLVRMNFSHISSSTHQQPMTLHSGKQVNEISMYFTKVLNSSVPLRKINPETCSDFFQSQKVETGLLVFESTDNSCARSLVSNGYILLNSRMKSIFDIIVLSVWPASDSHTFFQITSDIDHELPHKVPNAIRLACEAHGADTNPTCLAHQGQLQTSKPQSEIMRCNINLVGKLLPNFSLGYLHMVMSESHKESMVLSKSQKERNKLLHWILDVMPNKIGGSKFSVALPGEIIDAAIYRQESCTTDHHELQFRWYASDLQEQVAWMSSDHFYNDAFDQELHFIKTNAEGCTWYEAELICKAKGRQLPGILPIPYLGGLVRHISSIV